MYEHVGEDTFGFGFWILDSGFWMRHELLRDAICYAYELLRLAEKTAVGIDISKEKINNIGIP